MNKNNHDLESGPDKSYSIELLIIYLIIEDQIFNEIIDTPYIRVCANPSAFRKRLWMVSISSLIQCIHFILRAAFNQQNVKISFGVK